MKIYYQNGCTNETGLNNKTDGFWIVKNSGLEHDKYMYPGDSTKYITDIELVALYDKFRDLFFPDIEQYYRQKSLLPIFVQEAGQDSDSGLTADLFRQWIECDEYKKPDFYRHIYLDDCQYLVGTIQNLLSGMEYAFISYYTHLSEVEGIPAFTEKRDETTYYVISEEVRGISSLLESYFTKAYSILDMFSKIAFEFEHPITNISRYKKLNSADILWGARKNLAVNGTAGTVFDKDDSISMIEALRNEVVHNGSWELNPKVYVVCKGGVLEERYVLFPDIENGHLATVKNRRHFFGQGRKVNEILPQFHISFLNKVLNTAKMIKELKFT